MVEHRDIGAVERRDARRDRRRDDAWVRFGGVMMTVVGAFSAIEGVLALAAPTTYRSTGGTVLAIDLVGWGWIHLVLGVVVLGIGLLLLRTDPPGWARIVGMLVVGLGIVVQLAWLPAQPIWAIVVVALDVLVLRALALTWSEDYVGAR
ncbi:hypothetical protein PHK61_29175 [Actinomycetospora lutea]|uniref:DUF7144 family membrane protein n=1 Tax=Actinomycetospora lutea TaxID=663604 RepID=UPI002366C9BE|nr:hypothetical protein [Actinomycetospora lutea]MDD7942494.1 hypothetical protein [Actinomycetospora lutea]